MRRFRLLFVPGAFLFLLSANGARLVALTACHSPDLPHRVKREEPPLQKGAKRCHTVEIENPGLWLIDLRVNVGTAALPRLELLEDPCDPLESPTDTSLRVLHRMPASALLEVDTPGRYAFCVRAEDPKAVLGSHRLTSWFSSLPSGKSDPDEDEPDPDPLTQSREDPAFCDLRPGDDHSDRWPCATPIEIGISLAAHIGESSIDSSLADEDLFQLWVDDWRTVVIASKSSLGLAATLFSADGYRLATGSTGPSGDFRLVRTLAPGLYLLRVSAQGTTAGNYILEVRDAG